MKNSDDIRRDQITWKWNGGAVSLSQLGDPSGGTAYAFCLYDTVALAPVLKFEIDMMGATTCGSRGCWTPLTRGVQYRDSVAATGIGKFVIKTTTAGAGRFMLKAGGVHFTMPALATSAQLFAQDDAVTLQLVNTEGACWTARFSSPATSNTVALFSDKSD